MENTFDGLKKLALALLFLKKNKYFFILIRFQTWLEKKVNNLDLKHLLETPNGKPNPCLKHKSRFEIVLWNPNLKY